MAKKIAEIVTRFPEMKDWKNPTDKELRELVNITVEQTKKWMELGMDISDPCVVTPLEEMADNYPAIAEYCNDILIEMVKEQMNQMKNSLPDVNEEVLDEF